MRGRPVSLIITSGLVVIGAVASADFLLILGATRPLILLMEGTGMSMGLAVRLNILLIAISFASSLWHAGRLRLGSRRLFPRLLRICGADVAQRSDLHRLARRACLPCPERLDHLQTTSRRFLPKSYALRQGAYGGWGSGV